MKERQTEILHGAPVELMAVFLRAVSGALLLRLATQPFLRGCRFPFADFPGAPTLELLFAAASQPTPIRNC
jgi:glutathione S-transferase